MSAKLANITIELDASEVLTAAEAPSASSDLERTLRAGAATRVSAQLTGSTTPKLDKDLISLELTMTGSAVTVNLTSVAGLVNPPSATRTVDVTGGKLVGYACKAKSTNVAAINIAPGSSNPYPLFGSGNDQDLKPGQVVGSTFDAVATSYPAVSGTVKNIDISGTSGDVLYIDLYFGT